MLKLWTLEQDINRFDYSKKKKNDCPVFEKGHGNFYFIIEKRNDQIMVLLPDLYIHYGVYWEKMPNQKIQNLLKKININERLWVRINCTPTTFNFPFNLGNEPELMTYLTEDSNYDFENQTIIIKNILSYEFLIGPRLKIVPKPFDYGIEVDRL